MYRKILDRLHTPFGRYLIVGGSVYLLELVIIFLAQKAGASAIAAVALSYWLGLVTSFILTKFVTFGDKRTHHRVLIPQLVAVSLLVLFNFGFTLLVTKLLQNWLPAVITRTLALGITTLWNFYLYKTRIFKTETPIID
jgi:putative flippase GtrA